MVDFDPEYYRDVLHVYSVEKPYQLRLQLPEQHLILLHQQKIIDVDGEDDHVYIPPRERWPFLGRLVVA